MAVRQRSGYLIPFPDRLGLDPPARRGVNLHIRRIEGERSRTTNQETIRPARASSVPADAPEGRGRCGEHLGYLFTGVWSVLIGIGVIQGTAVASWLGWSGIVIGAGLAVGSAEFLGPNEERGWGLAGAAIPVLYIAWSLWLLAMGIALIA